ncbi:MAG: GNAT family protein [Bacteroidota bacterium]
MLDFNFQKTYSLENNRVRLLPLQMEHLEHLVEPSKDAAIWVYFLEKGNGRKNLTAYFKNALQNRALGKEYPFVVFDKLQQQYAGTTRFYEFSKELKTIKLGHTWYGKNFRGTGLNKHCKYLLFQFAFEQIGVERIGFGAYKDNVVSVAAMKSVGCQVEGILRNIFPALDGNGRADGIVMSVLKDEWSNQVKQQLAAKIESYESAHRT